MTRSSDNLCNVRPYHGSSQIQVANESHLASNEIGAINPSFRNVYASSKLSNNLVLVGQLVEKKLRCHFLPYGCLVQIRCQEDTRKGT